MSIPAYKKIQSYILRGIDSGLFAFGQQIPTEAELGVKFAVSRMTVNKAISELSQKGILNRISGKGTFVIRRNNDFPVMEVFDISVEIKLRGNKYSGKVLQIGPIVAREDIALFLDVMEGETIAFCKMLHYENDIPIMQEERYINNNLISTFLDQDFNHGNTPSSFLLKNYPLSEMEHAIEAISASQEVADYLAIPVAAPCLQLSRRTWSDNYLISYCRMISASSRYKIRSHTRIE